MEFVRFHSTTVDHGEVDSKVLDKEEQYTVTYKTDQISRDDYIISCWNEKYEKAYTEDIDRIRAFISSSSKLQSWYAEIMINYQSNVVMPDYLKDVMEVKEYNKLLGSLKSYNSLLKARSDSIAKAAKVFKTALDTANDQYDKQSKSLLRDKVLYVLTLNRSDLPLDLQQELIDFVPKDISSPKERREHAKNVVIGYQKGLIRKIKEDETFDVHDYVERARDVFRG